MMMVVTMVSHMVDPKSGIEVHPAHPPPPGGRPRGRGDVDFIAVNALMAWSTPPSREKVITRINDMPTIMTPPWKASVYMTARRPPKTTYAAVIRANPNNAVL